MEKTKKIGVHDLDVEWLAWLLQRWDLEEFVELTREKNIDGKKLLDISEGLVKLWRPRSNAKKFMAFVEDIKSNPYKYLYEIHGIVNNNNKKLENNKKEESEENEECKKDDESDKTGINNKTMEDVTITEINNFNVADQYQIITIKKKDESKVPLTNEEIIKLMVPHKSFLYRHQKTFEMLPSYLPMDSGMTKKSKLYKTNSYDYPLADIKNKLFKKEYSNYKGYYQMKRRSKHYTKSNKSRYKWFRRSEETPQIYPDDHFYEDLCFNEDDTQNTKKTLFQHRRFSVSCIVKIQELFQNFRVPPFLKKTAIIEKTHLKKDEIETEDNLYEASESVGDMYDSIKDDTEPCSNNTKYFQLPVEDYLVPVQLNKEYCDVKLPRKDESIMRYILNIFGTRFGFRRETNDDQQLSDSETKIGSTATEDGIPEQKLGHTNMADRPLPVPVENEPYYVNISREQAEDLLQGQPDGTYLLRPSSQSDHVYTLSIACEQTVHNVGIRRRPDGKLALGYPRNGEVSFLSITSLLEYHQKRRLLLVSGGNIIGATKLNEPPVYYQTPKNIPVEVSKL